MWSATVRDWHLYNLHSDLWTEELAANLVLNVVKYMMATEIWVMLGD